MPKGENSKFEVDTKANATEMAEAIFGSGIEVTSASYTGADKASGIYSGADDAVAPSETGLILSTGKADKFLNSGSDPNKSGSTSQNWKEDGDSDLDAISGGKTFDAAVLEAEFVPQGDTLTMQVTFGSEEYSEWVNAGYNDAVGIWVNGEKAELVVGEGDITVDNINQGSNSDLFLENSPSADVYATEMDGLTVTLTLKAPVIPGEVNTIKIGIADGGDGAYDSNLLIAGDSIQTDLIAQDDSFDVPVDGSDMLDVLANDSSAGGATLSITAINGMPMEVGDTLLMPNGDELTLNPDGTVGFASGGAEGPSVFSYEVTDEFGNVDTAVVELESMAPCFTAGTLIDTPEGQRAVEAIRPGDLVLTRDHGAQPVTWAGGSTRRAVGRDAPIRLAAGALGDHGLIELSQQHRVMIAGAWAQLLFGADEVLVKAKDLVNDSTIRPRADGGPVHYVHLLFARHEIVTGNGLPSESYHPGDQSLEAFDAETRAEILRLAPGADGSGPGIGPAARMSLKSHEARVLMACADGAA